MTKPMMDLRQLVEKSGDGAVTLWSCHVNGEQGRDGGGWPGRLEGFDVQDHDQL